LVRARFLKNPKRSAITSFFGGSSCPRGSFRASFSIFTFY
jgi:hypothetical protein